MSNWIERLDIQPLTAQDVRQIVLHSVLAILLAFGLCILLGVLTARAHDELGESDWIGQSQAKSPVTGQLCCGKNDCPRIPEEYVHDEPDGVHVRIPGRGVVVMGEGWEEIIPYKEVQPSADGFTYRCAWPSPRSRKCFFRKMPGS